MDVDGSCGSVYAVRRELEGQTEYLIGTCARSMRSAPRNDGADIPSLPTSIIYTWVVVVCARKPLVSMHASYMMKARDWKWATRCVQRIVEIALAASGIEHVKWVGCGVILRPCSLRR
jgi:hypothetical protein